MTASENEVKIENSKLKIFEESGLFS